MKKIGVLGGSFNPVHNGHLRLALEAVERLGLDRVELVPAPRPPHKPETGLLGFDKRVSLLEAAISGVPQLAVNPLEGARRGPSYTFHTLEAYRALSSGDEIFFILGAGDLLTLTSWFRGLELTDLAHLAVGARPDVSGAGLEFSRVREFVKEHWPKAQPDKGGTVWNLPSGNRLLYLEIPLLDISAAYVREKWRRGQNIRGLVPESVEQGLFAMRLEAEKAWQGT
ncbi:MAG: nicotinate (nicotinamide) nucleotide adenylyltransferase [Thermodesulfobacteriota bacterium]|nr:nicotinate (nicotinamide) nucleotide adenylyltransferase [Thermodesulfobacteriota bacterium]